MPEPTFSMTADDDLPRTIRREREAREREAREREARERQATRPVPVLQREGEGEFEMRAPAATVVDFDVPLAKLAMFFVRAVFAAIPALLVADGAPVGSRAYAADLLPAAPEDEDR